MVDSSSGESESWISLRLCPGMRVISILPIFMLYFGEKMLPSGCSAKEMTRGTGSPIARAHMVPITSCARNSSKRTSLRIKLKGRGRTPLTGRSPDHLQYRRPIGTKRTLWKNPRTRSQNLDWMVGMGGNYRISSQAADKNISQLTSRSCLIWDVDMLTCRYTTKEVEKDELIDGERRDLARNRTTTSTWSPTTQAPSRRIVIGCFRCSRPVTFSAILQYQNLRGSKVSLCRNVLQVDSTTDVSGETLALQAWSAIRTDRRSAVILDGPEVHKYVLSHTGSLQVQSCERSLMPESIYTIRRSVMPDSEHKQARIMHIQIVERNTYGAF